MLQRLISHFRDRTTVIRECRNCGTTVDEQEECPDCGGSEIIEYRLEET